MSGVGTYMAQRNVSQPGVAHIEIIDFSFLSVSSFK